MVANRLPPKHRALHDHGAAHALKVWRRFDAAFHPQRAGGRASLEGAGWQSLRTRQLEREPWCRACAARGRKTPATHVDHILSRRARPDLAADRFAPASPHVPRKLTADTTGGKLPLPGGSSYGAEMLNRFFDLVARAGRCSPRI